MKLKSVLVNLHRVFSGTQHFVLMAKTKNANTAELYVQFRVITTHTMTHHSQQ